MTDWRDSLDPEARELLKKRDMPSRVRPMLAILTDRPFSDPDWLYERKLDGERCIALSRNQGSSLYSRKPKLLNATYPEIREALDAQAGRFVVDGELVAFEGKRTSFSRLQQRMQIRDASKARASGVKVYYYLFDLLYLDGYDLAALPLRTRKALLRRAVRFEDPLRFTAHRNEDGANYLKQACHRGWEGLIAKQASAPYQHSRSRKWLKFKCVNQQELIVVGYTDPQGERIGFGALLLGYYEGHRLRYAGRVGTGFDEAVLRSLLAKMRTLESDGASIEEADERGGEVHWIRPALVAEIGFTEWTNDGRLRHPRFLGLRDDKDPEEVIRERPGASQ